MTDLLISGTRIVPLTSAVVTDQLADVRISNGLIAEIAPHNGGAHHPGIDRIEADGRYLIPGLWDQHVHATQWARTSSQLDTAGTGSADEVIARVTHRLASQPPAPGEALFGWGHRSAAWAAPATVAQLDAVSGDVPVVLVSGDGHNGWLNSAACRLLDLTPPTGALEDAEWFPVFRRLDELRKDRTSELAAMRETVARANRLGIVGITDMEFGRGWEDWAERVAGGIDTMRVRTASYADTLDDVIAAGLRTGTVVAGGRGLISMGPLKIISDGSINTRTAWCHDPYTDGDASAPAYGAPNLPLDELEELIARATEAGLEIACHAIGDAAVATALDAFVATGARGSLEHAQLTAPGDVRRMAELGVVASVQPAHLWDDRDLSFSCWADRTDRCFMLRSMLDAGVRLALGSDAPVSPLDPWLAMAAAVHRSGDARAPWNPAEAITAKEALAASTGGVGTPAVGTIGDLVLLERDPLDVPNDDSAAAAEHLREIGVAATIVAGRVAYDALG